MKKNLAAAYRIMVGFGFDPLKFYRSLCGIKGYLCDLRLLKNQEITSVRKFTFGKFSPQLGDRFSESGEAKGHYFHQDLLVARRINVNNPIVHVDLGSRVDGFVAHVASFRPIMVIDIRPFLSKVKNITFMQVDMMGVLPSNLFDYCDSLSCLHALEHFGLGRYGDPVNYDGYLLGLDNLYSILRKNGKLYFSTPIGPQRIEFNAHRVFSVGYLLECFEGKYIVDRFSFVDDEGDLFENVELTKSKIDNNFGCQYGCGIFEMTKL